jgi:hypothetical protein
MLQPSQHFVSLFLIKQAGDVATLNWLDGQALALIKEKDRLRRELEKFRPVGSSTLLCTILKTNVELAVAMRTHVLLRS